MVFSTMASPTTEPERINFSVDAALLRELGERLVGRPHIALAELVKNSYDADAMRVDITFGHNAIHIVDNGHGMNEHAFRHFWMRIGSPHKQDERLSKKLCRPLTGSKGVGRLAVQFLARKIRIRTVFEETPNLEIVATVDWNEATQQQDLVNAYAQCVYRSPSGPFPGGARHGTEIVLYDLNQDWNSNAIKGLAREIWFLQPPFRQVGSANEFEVQLRGTDVSAAAAFEEQMRLHLDSWEARIVGKLLHSSGETDVPHRLSIDLQFNTAPTERYQYDYARPEVRLEELEFEVRVYRHTHRQRGGLKLDDIRNYFNTWGGVHVYDAGFRLPYYGQADADWLETEFTHAHRQSVSQLLPKELQVKNGMHNLPTRSRLFGVVHVNSRKEMDAALKQPESRRRDCLLLQVTRDRLVENGAYDDLKLCVKFALHLYAMKQTQRMNREKQESRSTIAPSDALERLGGTLEKYRREIPAKIYKEIERDVSAAMTATTAADESVKGRLGLLGALATAGIAALAYEHEVAKQLELLRSVGATLRNIPKKDGTPARNLATIAQQIDEWVDRAQGTRSMFAPLLNEENRTTRMRFLAKQVVQSIADQSRLILQGIPVNTVLVDQWLRLPNGRVVEWNAIFQNVLVNAVNAMIESETRRIQISSSQSGKRCALLVQDTGRGVDLSTCDRLFEPFERGIELPLSQRALGLGGSGLGLSIVKMVAEELGCQVAFIDPQRDFNTCFELSWREK